MTAPKKKHLIELMIEAGVNWPDGAEYAAQDKRDSKVYFFPSKPTFAVGYDYYACDDSFLTGCDVLLPSLCRNWHQTIVTREQYEQSVLARAAHTWQQAAQSNTEYCSSVMRQMSDNTIEQLAADYHAKAAEADRLQDVADEALKAADDALIALEKAGELIGLVISIDTKQKQEAQPEITDWRDLQVGDVIWVGELPGVGGLQSGEYTVSNVDHSEYNPVHVYNDGASWGVDLYFRKWRFIRRP